MTRNQGNMLAVAFALFGSIGLVLLCVIAAGVIGSAIFFLGTGAIDLVTGVGGWNERYADRLGYLTGQVLTGVWIPLGAIAGAVILVRGRWLQSEPSTGAETAAGGVVQIIVWLLVAALIVAPLLFTGGKGVAALFDTPWSPQMEPGRYNVASGLRMVLFGALAYGTVKLLAINKK